MKNSKTGTVIIRRARTQDGPGKHAAHMRSIREICARDYSADEISGWGHRSFDREAWSRDLAAKDKFFWVVDVDKQIEGFAHLEIRTLSGEQTAHVHGLYLTPKVGGQGHGKSLGQIMINHARDLGMERVYLMSTLTAFKFYRHLGFCEDGSETRITLGGSSVRCRPMVLDIIASSD